MKVSQKLPIIITLLSMIGGVVVAIWFGVNEQYFKNNIRKGIESNVKIQAISDSQVKKQKISKEFSKNWRYIQRYHFHSTGMGAMSLALLVFSLFIVGGGALKLTSQYFISIGGALYPFVWLFSGIYGPEMGRSEAKEQFAVFGYMGGLFLLGLLLLMYLACRFDFKKMNS